MRKQRTDEQTEIGDWRVAFATENKNTPVRKDTAGGDETMDGVTHSSN